MKKIRVGVAGYGTIGQRLADGVALQEDMELVGIADLAPTLSLQALRERDMIGENGVKYNLYLVDGADEAAFCEKDIPVAGSFDELCKNVDIMLDSAPGGVGAKNKENYYDKYGVKAIFQGGEKNSVADVFFHGYANYEKGVGHNYLKLTSCNTTGLIRTVDCLDRAYGIEKVAITIIRRVADPGDYHRGLTNALQMEKAPTHQALDLMTIMPHVNATGILVHTPVTHGHIITVLATAKDGRKITKEMALEAFRKHPPSPRASRATPPSSSTQEISVTAAAICTRSACGRTPSWNQAMTSCTPSMSHKSPSRSPKRWTPSAPRLASRRPARRARP